MKVFISHKQEDAVTANQIANELDSIHVDYYLDLLGSDSNEKWKNAYRTYTKKS